MRYYIFLILLCLVNLAYGQVALNVDSVYNWRDSEKGANGLENVYNEVWAYEKDGREYAILGARDGAYILDITKVKTPELIKFIPGKYAYGVNRDYHDYNGYLYMVCDQGESSLQIADLHYLPDSLPIVYDSDSMIIRCHNIFIDSATAKMYACGVTIPDTASGQRVDMQVYDLSKSYVPELLLTFDNDPEQFHDVYVRNDTVWGNRGRSGLFVYDFTNVKNVQKIWSLEIYSDQGYNHAGYLSEDGEYYYFGDETMGKDLKVVKVNDFDEAEEFATFNSGKNPESIVAHNLLVRDNLLFVSYYHEGLQIFDITDGGFPVKIGHYETFTRSFGDPPVKDYSAFDGAWGVYPYLSSGYILVSDRAKGLFIFDISKLDFNTHPELLPKGKIFPNPASNFLNIVYDPLGIKNIKIFDINGRLIEESSNFNEEKRIAQYYFRNVLQAGLYLIRIETNDITYTHRFVKE